MYNSEAQIETSEQITFKKSGYKFKLKSDTANCNPAAAWAAGAVNGER